MKVSVWMSAYNHERYIEQCLDSVLRQKTNFDFEIILGEDCSKDTTREIAIKYQKKNPDKFKLFLPENNIGMMEMDAATLQMCSGEYLALLNGDDYWTDENKLQTQADFLDNDADAVLCFHKAMVENETTGESFEVGFYEEGNTMPVESLLKGYNPIMTPTVMLRNIFEIPDWYTALPYGDMPLYLMLSQKGKIKFIDKLMSVYRIHSNGQWQGESVYNNILKDLKFYKVMNEKLNYRYDELISKIFAQRYFDLVLQDIKNKNYDAAKEHFGELKNFEASSGIDKSDLKALSDVLFNGADVNNYKELFSREVKWNLNL